MSVESVYIYYGVPVSMCKENALVQTRDVLQMLASSSNTRVFITRNLDFNKTAGFSGDETRLKRIHT